MNEIVKYHNDFNKVKLPSFTEQEQNLLFGILTKIKGKPAGEKIIFYPKELLKFSTENLTYKALGNYLSVLKTNFFKADFTILVEDKEREEIGKETVNLFQSFTLWYSKDDVNYENLLRIEMVVNPRFEYLINELTKNFTRFELAEFITLSGKYTKTLYRLLKQYRQTGYMRMEWSEFARVMDIPKDYRQIDIDQRILKPALKELIKPRNLLDQERIPFKSLTYQKIKKGGNRVVEICFEWKPDDVQKLLEQADIYAEFSEKHKNKWFDFGMFGKQKLLGKGHNAEGESIFVFEDTEGNRNFADKLSNYPTEKSLKELERKLLK
ncbi:MAG: replication initiation protein [Helicobacter apodemus]|nr:replication initiation protein [Helicobacter apodemus]